MEMAVRYPGQKNIPGVYQKIINQIPEHTVYYELFAGSGQIAKILSVGSKVAKMYLNDINAEVNKFLTVVPGTITNLNAIDILQSETITKAHTDTFIFMDPPYLHSTRPNSTALYKYEFSDSDHVQLLLSIRSIKCNVMIIHPKCALYDDYLKNFRKVQIKIRYHSKTSNECLYMNYPEVQTLHNSQFLGNDCWDRQRIKRKGDRLVEKLLALPPAERNYIIERIKNL